MRGIMPPQYETRATKLEEDLMQTEPDELRTDDPANAYLAEAWRAMTKDEDDDAERLDAEAEAAWAEDDEYDEFYCCGCDRRDEIAGRFVLCCNEPATSLCRRCAKRAQEEGWV